MQNKKYYLLILGALLVYLFFLHSEKLPFEHENLSLDVEQKELRKGIQEKMNSVTNSFKNSANDKEKLLKDKKSVNQVMAINYINAFRNFTDFLLCKTSITDWQNKTLLKSFRQKLKDVKKFGFDGGKKHEEYYLLHLQHCKSYLLDDKELYDRAYDRLQKTYQNIQPETEREKQLAKIIAILDELGGLSSQLKIQRVGISSFPPSEVKKMQEKLRQLYSYIKPIVRIPEKERTATQNRILDEKSEQMSKIDKILRESYVKDDDLIQDIQSFSGNLKSILLKELTHIKTPDIFALMIMWKEQSYLTFELRGVYDKMISEITTKLAFKQDNFPRILALASFPLFACALDYPCGSDSQLTTYYCIIMANYHACGKSVEDFILEDYISPNIRLDVDSFLDLLLENYAQE